MKRPRVGLVLGGGGARGIAHIGVLRVLVREKVPIDLVVGTSMGGIVATLFALGVPPDELAEQPASVRGNSLLTVARLSARRRQKMLQEQLARVLAGKTFADLSIPVTLMAVDMLEGKEVALSEGPLLPAVLATSAMPAVFPPVELDGMQLADGGVIDSLATHQAFALGADKVIAVDVYPPLDKAKPWVDPFSAITGWQLPFTNGEKRAPGMLTATWRAARVVLSYVHEQRLAAHPPDVLLRPDVWDYGSLDFRDIEGPLRAGQIEAERHIEALRSLVG